MVCYIEPSGKAPSRRGKLLGKRAGAFTNLAGGWMNHLYVSVLQPIGSR